ncbi:hypothetical protein EWB00_000859 [Schistosoma japonicum]|uniref:Uncharacterized protein n=1 Tax=Schistosoma japonicum TaxID=6182 RepID=A0A4Z2CKA3_SCHJA|nr:hypothetical protein EWB00_000859 [Schistosoma japonicum]
MSLFMNICKQKHVERPILQWVVPSVGSSDKKKSEKEKRFALLPGSPSCHTSKHIYFVVILRPPPPEPSFFSLPAWTKDLCRTPLPSALTETAATSSLGMDRRVSSSHPLRSEPVIARLPDHFYISQSEGQGLAVWEPYVRPL